MASKEKSWIFPVGIGAIVLAFGFSRRAKAREVTKEQVAVPNMPAMVGKYFGGKEFLHSTIFPDIVAYKPTNAEIANVKDLVSLILDGLRQKWGTIIVDSGGRPEAVAQAHGTTWKNALEKAGYSPAEHSDHSDFIAADVKPTEVKPDKELDFLIDVRMNPNLRQGIAYFVTGPDKLKHLNFVHIAVVTDTHPAIKDPDHFFFMLDGKRMDTIPSNV